MFLNLAVREGLKSCAFGFMNDVSLAMADWKQLLSNPAAETCVRSVYPLLRANAAFFLAKNSGSLLQAIPMCLRHRQHAAEGD